VLPAGRHVGHNRQPRTRELEFHSLRLIIRQPEALYLLDRALQQAGVSLFTPQDFEHADHQVLVRLAQEALAQDEQEPNQYIQAGVPETLTDLFESLSQSHTVWRTERRPFDRRPDSNGVNPALRARERKCRPGESDAGGFAIPRGSQAQTLL
jgi:hypothetical protein